jgi:hypothetical protein
VKEGVQVFSGESQTNYIRNAWNYTAPVMAKASAQ